MFGGIVATGKQVVFAAQGYGAYAVFYRAVIYGQQAIGGIRAKALPALQGIVQGFTYCAFGQHLGVLLPHPLE